MDEQTKQRIKCWLNGLLDEDLELMLFLNNIRHVEERKFFQEEFIKEAKHRSIPGAEAY